MHTVLMCHAVNTFCQHKIIQSQCMQSVHAINSSSSTAVPAFVFVFHAHNIIFNTQIVFSFFIIIVPFRTKHKFEPIIRTITLHNLIECKVNIFLPMKQICCITPNILCCPLRMVAYVLKLSI